MTEIAVLRPVTSPWGRELGSLVSLAKDELLICSPYVTRFGIETVVNAMGDGFRSSGLVRFITDLSPGNIASGATLPEALSLLCASVTCRICHLPSLHAKVYVADSKSAVVSSGNLTFGGLRENYEYGLHVTDSQVVGTVRSDILEFGSLGGNVSAATLDSLTQVAGELRDLQREHEQRTRRATARRFREVLDLVGEQLVRERLAGGAVHTVFARTIEYLLMREGPLKTGELHPKIASIHPDLCDDAVDRVIDGKRYGKKWKHAVRTAQQQLKRRGTAEYDGSRWRLTNEENA